jgi:hypothetical protein
MRQSSIAAHSFIFAVTNVNETMRFRSFMMAASLREQRGSKTIVVMKYVTMLFCDSISQKYNVLYKTTKHTAFRRAFFVGHLYFRKVQNPECKLHYFGFALKFSGLEKVQNYKNYIWESG